MTERSQVIVDRVRQFYTDYKADEVAKILSRTDWQDAVQEYIRAKAKVDVIEASEDSDSQSNRCVAFMVNHPQNKVVRFFVTNSRYKPAGLTTTVQIAYLCTAEWKQFRSVVLDILEEARTTKVADRREVLNANGFKDSPLLFLEHLLNTRLNVSLFSTKSKFYNGYNIKPTDVYDREAEGFDDVK